MQVTFLYKLVEGACPKSYGTNVARLAGIPAGVVAKAAAFAAQLEEKRCGNNVATQLSAGEQDKLGKICHIFKSGGDGDLAAALQACM